MLQHFHIKIALKKYVKLYNFPPYVSDELTHLGRVLIVELVQVGQECGPAVGHVAQG